jgi:N-acetylated-alpha-linked acidic dipeptidase
VGILTGTNILDAFVALATLNRKAPNVGLPGRAWYKNLIYAPGRFTGYGTKTLLGVREAIEDQRWADANRYAKLTADALNAYSDRLDRATAVLKGA